MASSISFTSVCSFKPSNKPDMIIGHSVARKVLRTNEVFGHSKSPKFQSLEVKASESNGGTKPNSIVCADCDGNVNSVDHFNGQFKVGGLCWLCRGKRDILCGNCNGAGFMSTFDE